MTGIVRQQATAGLRECRTSTGLQVLGLWMLFFLAQSLQAEDAPPVGSTDSPQMRVVLIGHLYSLLVEKQSRDAKPFNVEEHLAVLVDEVRQLQPDAVFLLGDITNNGKAHEWATIQNAFARQEAPVHGVPGNHDLTAGWEAFSELGGQGSRSVVVGQTKFILLGHESFPNALPNDNLASFIDRELEDHANYREVVILMHFLLKGTAYWEREIVPLLKGRVEKVFTGDLVRQHLKAQTDRDNNILYASSSIKFKGEGPAVFIVLEQTGSGLRAIPHVLPLELSQAWYEDDKDTETSADRFTRVVKRVPTRVLVALLVTALVVGILSIIGLTSLVRRWRSV